MKVHVIQAYILTGDHIINLGACCCMLIIYDLNRTCTLMDALFKPMDGLPDAKEM